MWKISQISHIRWQGWQHRTTKHKFLYLKNNFHSSLQTPSPSFTWRVTIERLIMLIQLYNLIIDVCLVPCLRPFICCAQCIKNQCRAAFPRKQTPGPDGPYSLFPYSPSVIAHMRQYKPEGSLPRFSSCSSSVQEHYDMLYIGEPDRKRLQWMRRAPQAVSIVTEDSAELARVEELKKQCRSGQFSTWCWWGQDHHLIQPPNGDF